MAASVTIIEEQNQATKKDRAANFLWSKAKILIALVFFIVVLCLTLSVHSILTKENEIEELEKTQERKKIVKSLPNGYYLSIEEYGHYALALAPMNFSEGKKYCEELGAHILEFQNCSTRIEGKSELFVSPQCTVVC